MYLIAYTLRNSLGPLRFPNYLFTALGQRVCQTFRRGLGFPVVFLGIRVKETQASLVFILPPQIIKNYCARLRKLSTNHDILR